MAVTINGTSGITTPGIINSGNETITGNTAITGILSVNGNNISPFPTFRNKIINGTIFFDQRNSGANTTLSTNNNVYTVDRWWGQVAANTTGCVAYRTADFPTGYQYSLRVQRTSANTGTSAITIGQIIESTNCVDLQGQYVTLSFWAKAGANFSATSSNITVTLATGTTADEGMAKFANSTWTGYSAAISTTQPITTTWTRYSLTTAATLGTSILETGVSFSYTPTGTASTNDWFEITGVQLEAGTVATPYEARPVSTELALCQRYYQTGAQWVTSATNNWSYFPVQMRATPTVSGGGAGFTTALLNQYGFAGSQTTGASQTLVYTIEL